jgi:hypothetical protein
MGWTIEDGTAKAAIYPTGPNGEPWVPKADQHDKLGFDPLPPWGPTEAQAMRIKYVVGVASCGGQGFHVLVEADSAQELPRAVAHVKERLARLFDGGQFRAACRAAGNGG